jgi:hypothetical protein
MFKNDAAWSYRDAEAGLRARRDELAARREAEVARLDPEIGRIYVRRRARTLTGKVAVFGAAIMAAAAVEAGILMLASDPGHARLSPTLCLMITVAVLPFVYAFERLRARRAWNRALAALSGSGGDVRADLARLEQVRVSALAAGFAERLARESVAWPLLGASFVVPLALHLAYGLVFFRGPDLPYTFDWWISLSLVVTAAGHAVLGTQSWKFARELVADRPTSAWKVYGWVCLAGLFPGTLLYFVPPLLIALTAIAFVPGMLAWMRNRFYGERRALSSFGTSPTLAAN